MSDLVRDAQELGHRVLQRWRAAGRRHAAFADLAHAELEAVLPHLVAPADAWFDELASRDDLPPVASPAARAFGEPPVHLWQRAGVGVDVYFWLGPMTGLHDHGFVGAFGVLDGPSVHTVYRFESDTPASAPVRTGNLLRRRTEMLLPGDLRAIGGADRLPHRVIHLGAPSLSICVRTFGKVTRPQRAFFAPSISVASEQHLPATARHRIGLALHLFRRRPPDAAERLARLVDGLPDLAAFWTLWQPFVTKPDAALLMQTLSIAAPRPWFDALVPAMFELVRLAVDWANVDGVVPRLERAMALENLPDAECALLRARLAGAADRAPASSSAPAGFQDPPGRRPVDAFRAPVDDREA
jgi:hypothetical protein